MKEHILSKLWRRPPMNAIAAGVFLAFASNSAAHAASDCKLSDFGTLPVDMTGEQATTIVKVNGENTRFILDTGAFFNSMSKANADALQLRREAAPFGLRGSGIGGDFSLQVARIKEFGILGTSLRNIEFLVGGSDIGMPLIGANLLDFADLDIDLARGKLRMMKAQGRDCDRASMAYWAKNGDYQVVELRRLDDPNDRRSFVTVSINGKPVKALLDTGAYATLLTRKAANSAGIDLDSPGVESSYITHGLGTKAYKTWTAPVDTFTVGTETIQHSKMQVFDGTISDNYAEMLLGVDFFLAHHLFIANSQHKVYFTYNGGRVFTLAKPPGQIASPQTSPGDDKDTPKDADDLARRGQAHLSRGESAAALADLDEAIRLAPDVAANYLVRARVHLVLDQPNAALADLDKSLELGPTNVEALLLRAQQRLTREELTGAKEDIEVARHLVTAASEQARAIATLYIAADQPDAALPLLDDWIRAHGNDASLGSALNERCWARGLANQMLDRALDDCNTAIKRDGPNAAYLDSLGLIELRLKNYAAAINAYEQALAKSPRAAGSRYGLGLAKIRSGRVDDGNADLAAAKALEPKIEERFARFNL